MTPADRPEPRPLTAGEEADLRAVAARFPERSIEGPLQERWYEVTKSLLATLDKERAERARSPEGLRQAWDAAMAWADAKGALLYEVKRRWEGGVKDGWYAMAVRDGWFWREEGDTPEEALRALVASDGRKSAATGWSRAAPTEHPATEDATGR